MSGFKMLRLSGAMEKSGLSRSSIYALEAAGLFPSRVCIGGRCVAWVEAEVEDWIRARIAASRATAIRVSSGSPGITVSEAQSGESCERKVRGGN